MSFFFETSTLACQLKIKKASGFCIATWCKRWKIVKVIRNTAEWFKKSECQNVLLLISVWNLFLFLRIFLGKERWFVKIFFFNKWSKEVYFLTCMCIFIKAYKPFATKCLKSFKTFLMYIFIKHYTLQYENDLFECFVWMPCAVFICSKIDGQHNHHIKKRLRTVQRILYFIVRE